jgi:hypothetical protein
VVAAILARIRDKLFAAGPMLSLERVLSIFEIGSERGASTSRETLACLLGHMRLGISVAEADEVVTSIASAGSSSVHLSSLFEQLQRAGEPEQEILVDELREAVRERFLGRGNTFSEAALRSTERAGDFLSESEFRYCLAQALVDDGIQATPMDQDDEDRTLLLAEKSASGAVRWRKFATTYLGWHDDEYISNDGNLSPKKGGLATTQQTWHQTWRSGKTALPERTMAYTPEKESPSVRERSGSTEPPPKRGGPCRCLTKLFGGN